MTERQRGIWEMVGAMTISGTIGWFVLFSGTPIMTLVFWRCVIGATVLLAICHVFGYLRRDLMSRRQFLLAVLAGIALVGNWLLLFSAYSHTSIAIATTVYNVQPFFLFAFGIFLFGERLTFAKAFWLVAAFVGVVMIAQSKPGAGYGDGSYPFGIALTIGAAFLYAVAAALTKALKGIPPHVVALIQITVGAVMLAPLAIWQEFSPGPQAWMLIGTLGLVHTGLMYILLYGAIQKLPTNLTGSLSFIYPVVAIIVDYVALGHSLRMMQIVGIAIILFSAAGMTLGWSPGRRNAAVPQKRPVS